MSFHQAEKPDARQRHTISVCLFIHTHNETELRLT